MASSTTIRRDASVRSMQSHNLPNPTPDPSDFTYSMELHLPVGYQKKLGSENVSLNISHWSCAAASKILMLARLFDPRKKGTITLTDKRAPGCGNSLGRGQKTQSKQREEAWITQHILL